MSTFKRENRYIVIKRKDLRDHHERFNTLRRTTGFSGSLAADQKPALEKSADNIAEMVRDKLGKPPLECLVIESDWPEYEPTWAAIEARMCGKQPDTLQVSRTEYEALRRDAERYREARQGKALRVECVNRHGKPVIYVIGERDEAVDFPEQYDAAIDAAINMPANGEGGE